MIDKLISYGKVWAFGSPALSELLVGPVVAQEKVDGSQFSFGIIDGTLMCRSKGVQIDIEAPDRLFAKAVEYVKSIKERLPNGAIFRCEYLAKPKHNVLVYDRTPRNNLVLFDVQVPDQDVFVERESLETFANNLGISVVPELWRGEGKNFTEEVFKKLLDTPSFLGGQKVEGFVVKNFSKRDRAEGALLKGKFVNEAFKELHGKTWKMENPRSKDIVEVIMSKIGKEAYWNKALQHLKEEGKLTSTPKDIGPLLKELNADVEVETSAMMTQMLLDWARPQINRMLSAGFPQWYKEKLASEQLNAGDTNEN